MTEPFYQRFHIEVDLDVERKSFLQRVRTVTRSVLDRVDSRRMTLVDTLFQAVCFELGEQYESVPYASRFMERWDRIVRDDFVKCLRITEAMRSALVRQKELTDLAAEYSRGITVALKRSEVDLEISWNGEIFTKTGARLLDDRLVNDPLEWLRDPKYGNVLVPFEKGLKHWMEGHKNPERYGDVITDVYEAVEALAKLVTGRDADLSANREKLAAVLGLPEAYKKMLKEYIDFGCEYRHSPETRKPRTYPSERDTEAFIYMTGVSLRLAMQTKW